jgi:hypothetical protein
MPEPAEAGNVICLTRERYRRGQNYFLLPHEDPVAFRKQREALDATYEPDGLIEEMAVERIHMAMHRVARYGYYLRSVEEAPIGAPGSAGTLTPQQKERSVNQWQKLIRQGERSIESAIRHFRRTRRFNEARDRGFGPKPRGPRRSTPA